MNNKCYREQIDEVLDSFDFEKVKKFMDMIDWRWASTDGVPEIYHLRKKARKLLFDLVEKNDRFCSIGTGGFWVFNRYGRLSLHFSLAYADDEIFWESKDKS